MELKPITRQEQIIAGKNLKPITRMEMFLKEYRGGSGGVGSWDDLPAPMPTEFLPYGVPYVENGITDLLPETDASSITHPTFGKMWTISGIAPDLKVGETYTVTYNGTPYECVCQAAQAGLIEDSNAVAMGNFSVVGGANTGEPFAMLISFAYQEVDIIDLVGSSAVKVKIAGIGEIAHKMEDACLPDTARVLVVKFAEREDGNLVSTSHTYQQMKYAVTSGVPIVCIIQYSNRAGGSTATFSCSYGNSYIVGVDHYSGLFECRWSRAWEYDEYYLDGNTSNRTIGNELWIKPSS